MNSDSRPANVDSVSGANPTPIRVRWQDSRNGWSLRVKLQRVAWAPFRILFLPGTGRWLSWLRVWALLLFGARIARPVLIMDGVKVWYPWNLTLGRHCRIGRGVEVYNFAPVHIGEQAAVSQDTYLCTASHDHERVDMPLIYRPIRVEDEAWVSSRCFVAPGVTVGRGAVVGAASVVTRDVPPWTVVAGNPARIIKARKLSLDT